MAVGLLVAGLFSVGLPQCPAAQPGNENLDIDVRVNYVYASQFGFGRYDVGGLSVGVYTLPLAFSVPHVWRDVDLRLALPVTYGRYRFRHEFEFLGQPARAAITTNTLATEPRLMLDFPIVAGLRITPLGAWGFGGTFGSSSSLVVGDQTLDTEVDESMFYTYQIGVSSLYERPWRTFTWLLGASVIRAGDGTFDRGDEATAEDYTALRAGTELRHPLWFDVRGRIPDAGITFVYDYFLPRLQFTRAGRADLEVDQIFEFGLTVGSSTPLDLPWLGGLLDGIRIGASYQKADGLDGFRITTGLPF